MDMLVIDMIAQWVFVVTLALYLATNLQWYNYSFKRAIFRHHKFMWHIYYCLVPFTLYFGTFFSYSTAWRLFTCRIEYGICHSHYCVVFET